MPTVLAKKKLTRNAIKGDSVPHFYCRKCNTVFSSKVKFYNTTNPYLDANGMLSICRNCCNVIYKEFLALYNDHSRAMYESCKELDICFSYSAFDMSYSHIQTILKRGIVNSEIMGFYIGKLTGYVTTGSRGLRFKDSDNYKFDSNSVEQLEQLEIKTETNEEKLLRLSLIWGKNKDVWEYDFLENELYRIQTSFECSDYGMELIQKDIAYLNLAIEKDRGKGGDAQKLIESRSKLMADAKMKPVQATGIESNDAITFGTLIKKWEDEKPIPTYLDDDMKLYIDTYFVGQIAKMEGIENEATQKMDKDLEKFTIDFENLNILEDKELDFMESD